MPTIAGANAATKQELRDVSSITVFATFVANDATPSVAAGGTFKTANTNPTTITNFDGGYNGQRIAIVVNDANTIFDFSASSLVGNSGTDWSASSGDTLFAVNDGTFWYCVISSPTDHVLLDNIGTNSHADIDTHIADSTQHYLESSINHANIQTIGTYSHTQIDTFIDTTYPAQNSKLESWISANNATASDTGPLASGLDSIAFGELANAEADYAIALGAGAYAGNQGNIALGQNSIAYSDTVEYYQPNNLALGQNNLAIGDEGSIAIGNNVVSSALRALALGNFAEARGIKSIAIGEAAADNLNSIAIGDVTSTTDYEIILGTDAVNAIRLRDGILGIYGNNGTEWATVTGPSYVDNTGATGIVQLDLPVATLGKVIIAERVASFTYRLNPQDTEYFAGSSAGLYKSLDSDGAYIKIECLSTGIWHVMASFGTITDE